MTAKYLPLIVLGILSLFFTGLALNINFSTIGEQQFSYLAQSFLNGKTYFLEIPGSYTGDLVFFGGHYYWAEGPFPAMVLMPFVKLFSFLNIFFLQGYLNFFLGLACFVLVHNISILVGFDKQSSLWASFAFIFCSSMMGIFFMSWVWYFSQMITITLSLTAIYFFLNKNSLLVVGIVCSLLVITRINASFIIIYFLLASYNGRLSNVLKLVLPYVLGVIVFFLYNFLRFNNLFETGYSLAQIPEFLARNRDIGLFSLRHLPTNVYYMFLNFPIKSLRADHMGMSIFLLSPYLFYFLRFHLMDKISLYVGISMLIVAIPVLTYCGTGFNQFGARFSLDFFPLLFLLFLSKYHDKFGQISKRFKYLIIFSSVLNSYLFYTWLKYGV